MPLRPSISIAARGEIVSSQATFRSAGNVDMVSADITDLRHVDGDAVIATSAVRLQWVRYIDVDRNTTGIPDDELLVKAPASIPDPFRETPHIAVTANQTQPLWIEIHVPAAAKAGDYRGTLKLTSGDESLETPLELHVWDFEVPTDRHLSVINWWRFPGPGFDNIEPYGQKYGNLLGQFCTFLVEHRQTDVQTSPPVIAISAFSEVLAWIINKQAVVVRNRLADASEPAMELSTDNVTASTPGRAARGTGIDPALPGSRYTIRSAVRLRRMYPATRTLKNSFSGSRSCTPTRIG